MTEKDSHQKVNIFDTETKAWVCSYKLLVRFHGKSKWITIGTFQANSDTLTEVVHKLDVKVRYLKIIPKTFHQEKQMIVGIYGKSDMEHIATDVITYNVTYPNNQSKVPDGYIYNSYGRPKNKLQKQRQKLKSECRKMLRRI